MGLTPKFTKQDIRNYILKKIKVIEDVVLDQLKQVGEQFVKDARSRNTYKDVTRNLRGSIGYSILKDGVAIFGNYDGTAVGKASATNLVKSLQGDFPKGFVLIVVAGMEYALYVESKGYDVITGSSQLAEANLRKSINKLKTQLRKVK